SLENSQTALKELISYTEDADIASLIMDLKHQENVLQASLQTGAKIIQPTLLDFLR
ncbi:MAG: flagellar hook-associated protein FlgL, partial [archaeon]|nr:flagellar hook-associated protein FlgL [archaeon]